LTNCSICGSVYCTCAIQVVPQSPIVVTVTPTSASSNTSSTLVVGPGQGGAIGAQGVQGTQGTQGVQGRQGTQGIQGPNAAITFSETPPSNPLLGDRWVESSTSVEYTWIYDGNSYAWVETSASGFVGAQGTQGNQGVTGAQGTQGTQGVQGTIGLQGVIGTQGVQGITGASGVSSSYFNYKVDANSTANAQPSSGKLRYNNPAQISSTALYINHLTTGNIDIDMFLALLQINDNVFIQDSSNSNNYQQFKVSGAINPGNNTYVQVPVTYVDGLGTGLTGFADNYDVILVTTAVGIQGTIGFTGNQGAQGPQGLQGVQGTQGLQGLQGILGTQGIVSQSTPPDNTGILWLDTSAPAAAPVIADDLNLVIALQVYR
jgi:hypothetical protein